MSDSKPRRRLPPALMVELAPRRRPNLAPLWLALGVSLVLHAGVITVKFVGLDENKPRRSSMLEVLLVNGKHDKKPLDAKALAQANLDGGGNTEQQARIQTPLPAQQQDLEGDSLQQMQQRQEAQEQLTQQMLQQLKQSPIPTLPTTRDKPLPEPVAPVSGSDEETRKRAMDQLVGEINQATSRAQTRPKRKFITASTRESISALYYMGWAGKVERVANLNYPEGLQGQLVLTVTILPNGELAADNGEEEGIHIDRSSGNKRLDAAAVRILRRAAPFERPGANLLGRDNRVVIITTMIFTPGGRLQQALAVPVNPTPP